MNFEGGAPGGHPEGDFPRAGILPGVEQRVVYSIYYNGTLVLPWRGERGVALAASQN